MNKPMQLGILLVFLFLCGRSRPTVADVRHFSPEPSWDPVQVSVIGDQRGTLTWTGPDYDDYQRNDYYIAAHEGERYRLRITNRSGVRIGLVIGVDGRNVVTGERSYGRSGEGMYVILPFQTIDISGWRSGLDQVQRFYFTEAGDSYAGRFGDRSQLGLIRVSAFRSRDYQPMPPIVYDERAGKSSGPRGSMSESRDYRGRDRSHGHSHNGFQPRDKAGTGYGEGSYDPVRETDFRPESFPAQLVTIRYEWAHSHPIRPYHHHHWRRDEGFAPPPP